MKISASRQAELGMQTINTANAQIEIKMDTVSLEETVSSTITKKLSHLQFLQYLSSKLKIHCQQSG
jgi:hypothetical protein